MTNYLNDDDELPGDHPMQIWMNPGSYPFSGPRFNVREIDAAPARMDMSGRDIRDAYLAEPEPGGTGHRYTDWIIVARGPNPNLRHRPVNPSESRWVLYRKKANQPTHSRYGERLQFSDRLSSMWWHEIEFGGFLWEFCADTSSPKSLRAAAEVRSK